MSFVSRYVTRKRTKQFFVDLIGGGPFPWEGFPWMPVCVRKNPWSAVVVVAKSRRNNSQDEKSFGKYALQLWLELLVKLPIITTRPFLAQCLSWSSWSAVFRSQRPSLNVLCHPCSSAYNGILCISPTGILFRTLLLHCRPTALGAGEPLMSLRWPIGNDFSSMRFNVYHSQTFHETTKPRQKQKRKPMRKVYRGNLAYFILVTMFHRNAVQ